MRGFTLIEMMIVVMIIGIVAAFGIAAFQDYIVRARVTNGLSLAASAKFAVASSVMESNGLPATQVQTGYQSPAPNEDVSSITIADDGTAEITVRYTARAGGGTIVLKPDIQANREITWTCTGGTLATKYRPANCR